MQTTVAMVREALGAEYVGVLELLKGEDALLLRWGAGWKDGWVGNTLVPVSDENMAGYALRSGRPMVISGLDTDSRFARTPVGRAHDGRSAVTRPIPTSDSA